MDIFNPTANKYITIVEIAFYIPRVFRAHMTTNIYNINPSLTLNARLMICSGDKPTLIVDFLLQPFTVFMCMCTVLYIPGLL